MDLAAQFAFPLGGEGDLRRPGTTTALERIAAIIADRIRADGGLGTCTVERDENGAEVLRIWSGAIGLAGSVQVVGGLAQDALGFNDPVDVTVDATLPGWTITVDSTQGTATFESVGTTAVDLSLVQVGDYVNVSGPEFLAANQGSFEITDVEVTWPAGELTQRFTIANPVAVAQSSTPQSSAQSILFYRPVRRTVNSVGSRAVIDIQGGGQVRLTVPATSAQCSREAGDASYWKDFEEFELMQVSCTPDGRATVETLVEHGLSPGDRVILTGSLLDTSAHAVVDESPGLTSRSPGSVASVLDAATVSRRFHTVTALDHARAVVVGGESRVGGVSALHTDANSLEFFNLTSESLDPTLGRQLGYERRQFNSGAAVAGIAREFHSAVRIKDPLALDPPSSLAGVLVYGGCNVAGVPMATGRIVLTDENGDGESRVAGVLGTARAGMAACVLDDGVVLLAGGYSAATTASTVCELWDPATNTVAAVASLPSARGLATATLLDDGRVLVVGGKTTSALADLDNGVALRSCAIYDPVGDTWTATGQLTYARWGHAAIKLPDGRVLVVGGRGRNPTNQSANSDLDSCEVWDPNTGLWAPAGRLTTARHMPCLWVDEGIQGGGAVNGLGSGRIYVTGGDSATIEYMDLGEWRWKISTAVLDDPRPSCAVANIARSPDDVAFGYRPAAFLCGGQDVSTEDTWDVDHLIIPGSESCRGKMPSGRVGEGVAGGPGWGNERVVDTVVDDFTFTFLYADAAADHQYGGTLKCENTPGYLVKVAAEEKSEGEAVGPYVFEPNSGPWSTGTETTTTEELDAGQAPALLAVADTTGFPNEPGYLTLGFGRSFEQSPVRYIGVASSTSLVLDPSDVLAQDVPQGATVVLLGGKGPFVPGAGVGGLIATGTPAWREAGLKATRLVRASGIEVEETVRYPGDRGLSGEGLPTEGVDKLSGIVGIYAPDPQDEHMTARREA